MLHETSVALDEGSAEFLRRQVAEGRYGSASDVVSAGLKLLRDYEEKLAALRAALIEGEESGPAEDFDFDEFLAEMNREGS